MASPGPPRSGRIRKPLPRKAIWGPSTSRRPFLETAGTEYVAVATGGSTIRDTNDLLGGLTRLADESSTYYLLGYQPEKPRDGRWHKLEVKVLAQA